MRLALIEDNERLANELKTSLKEEGYVLDYAADGEAGEHILVDFPLDLAIVDLGLPEKSGLDIIQSARRQGKNFPILILTARSQWEQKVEGLEAGADDYLTKPFDLPELLARVRALLRRSSGWASAELECPPVRLNPEQKQAWLADQPLSFTAQEFKLLHTLMQNEGKVFSKQHLQERIYDDESDPDSNVIEVFVRRIRKKLDPEGNLQPIETLRGQGYRWKLKRKT